MQRRTFLLAGLAAAWRAASAPAMRVTRLDTIYWKSRNDAPWWPHWVWLRVETDTGHFGIGETYPRNAAEAALIHSALAPMLLGRGMQWQGMSLWVTLRYGPDRWAPSSWMPTLPGRLFFLEELAGPLVAECN